MFLLRLAPLLAFLSLFTAHAVETRYDSTEWERPTSDSAFSARRCNGGTRVPLPANRVVPVIVFPRVAPDSREVLSALDTKRKPMTIFDPISLPMLC